jgi:HEAT repeat protein
MITTPSRPLLLLWPLALVAASAGGCASTSEPATGDLRLDLRHRDPRVRAEAAFRAAEAGREDLAEELIACLEDRDDSVRFIAGIALKRLTGRDFGYLSYSDPRSRSEAATRWRAWLLEERGGMAAQPSVAARGSGGAAP